MSTQNHLTKLRGFTLIELLVVISIIALLIGILLPALGAARNTARNVVCLSNIRQLAIANYSYATDNDEYYVKHAQNMTGSPYATRRNYLQTQWWWSSKLVMGNYMPGASTFTCPRFETSHDFLLDAGVDSDNATPTINDLNHPGHPVWNTVHYGANAFFLTGSFGYATVTGVTAPPSYSMPDQGSAPGTGVMSARMGVVKNVSETIAFADSQDRALASLQSGGGGGRPGAGGSSSGSDALNGNGAIQGIGYLYPAGDSPATQGGAADARHDNGINVAWADGHASAVKVGKDDDGVDRAIPHYVYGVEELTSVRVESGSGEDSYDDYTPLAGYNSFYHENKWDLY